MTSDAAALTRLYQDLLAALGPQHWWPARSAFEVVVGAIVTQNTNWRNVEKAIENLRRARLLSPRSLARVRRDRLARLIVPAGYFNVKAGRLKSFVGWLGKRYGFSLRSMFSTPPERLRRELLEVKGLGPETADSILLYAGGIPVFVVDAYTRRVFSRHGFLAADVRYEEARRFFQSRLRRDARLFNEYHALLVKLGKEFCRTRPLCEECPIRVTLERLGRPAPLHGVRESGDRRSCR
jgi:endonuclease-3 related protein